MLRYGLTLVGIVALPSLALAQNVPVSGSEFTFPATIENQVGEPVKLVLTGTALRTKYFLNIYALGSYLQKGTRVRSAEELAAVDAYKQLHLVMERDMDGASMASALVSSVRGNYPAPRFEKELQTLSSKMQTLSVRRGDRLWLTHVPGQGFYVHINGREQFFINNIDFSQAIWDIYLGRVNLGNGIKMGLVSRL